MNFIKYFLTLILVVTFFNTATLYAQKAPESNPLKEGSISNQFDHIIEKSGRYQKYKVVKKEWLSLIKANTLDTLKTLENSISTANQQISKQQNTITKLEESLSKINNDLTSITSEKDNMMFLGMAFTKSNYKVMMWAIVAILVVLLLFFIFKFKSSNSGTVQAKKALADIETEFEEHRRRSLEREQKVMRKLQDEINKQKKS